VEGKSVKIIKRPSPSSPVYSDSEDMKTQLPPPSFEEKIRQYYRAREKIFSDGNFKFNVHADEYMPTGK
jgi:hypothetical protein